MLIKTIPRVQRAGPERPRLDTVILARLAHTDRWSNDMTLRTAWLAGTLALALAPCAVLAEGERPRTVSVSGSGGWRRSRTSRRSPWVSRHADRRWPRHGRGNQGRGPRAALTRELRIDPKLVNANVCRCSPEYSWNDKDRKRVLLGTS